MLSVIKDDLYNWSVILTFVSGGRLQLLRAGPSPEGGVGWRLVPRQQVHIPGRLVTSPGLTASAAIRTNFTERKRQGHGLRGAASASRGARDAPRPR